MKQITETIHSDSFELLYSQFYPIVFRWASKEFRVVQDSEDIAQEVLIKVWRNLSSFKSKSEFHTWVYRIFKNHIISKSRKAKCRVKLCFGQVFDRREKFDNDPAQLLEEREFFQRVWSEIGMLEGSSRKYLLGHFIDGHSFVEIADKAQISANSVRGLVHRAKARIVAALSPVMN